uniref:Uncharacterized protein n=1 Tax=Arundo donax TaxID=35708 RepID=A0A0A9U1W6_ARUDO
MLNCFHRAARSIMWRRGNVAVMKQGPCRKSGAVNQPKKFAPLLVNIGMRFQPLTPPFLT